MVGEPVVGERRGQQPRPVEVGLGQRDVAGGGLQPRGQQQTRDPVRCRSPLVQGVRTRTAPAVPSPSTTQVQPKPFAIRTPEQRLVLGAPGQRGVDVGPFGSGDREALGLSPAAHVASHQVGGLGVPAGVRGERVAARQPGLVEAVGGESADAVEQPVAHRASAASSTIDQRAVDQPADRVQDRLRRHLERAEDVLGRVERAPPAKQDSAHKPRWSSGKSSS